MNILGLTKQDWKEAGVALGKVAIAFGSIVLTGLFLPAGFLFIVPPVALGIIGYNIDPKASAQVKKRNGVVASILGVAAGVGFYLAKVF